MALPSSRPLVITAAFDEYEQFQAELRDYSVETMLLKDSGFSARLLQWVDLADGTQFSRLRLRDPLRQWGGMPEGRSFVVLRRADMEMFWRGQIVRGSDIAAFPKAREFSADVRSQFDCYGLTVNEAVLLTIAEHLRVPGFGKRLSAHEVFTCQPQHLGPLRLALRKTEQVARSNPVAVRNLLRSQVLVLLVQAIAGSDYSLEPRTQPRRERAVKIASEFVVEHAMDSPSVAHLCRVAQVSDRTLELGFREKLGVTPKAFIISTRLQRFRKELLEADPELDTVAGIAAEWRFNHLGQLAQDYRRRFGELPSQTLARAGL